MIVMEDKNMAVYGIGCNYSGHEDVSEDFHDRGVACMGHDPDKYPYFTGLFKEIKNGDIIILKSLDMRRKKLKIKAIGIANNPKFEAKGSPGHGINVDWKKYDSDGIAEIDVSSDGGWQPRGTTIFKEYNKDIISQIENLLK